MQFAFKDSMIHIICNSHYVSHFAAFFIDTGAKISVVESCLRLVGGSHMESAPIASGWLVSGSFGWVWASRVMGKGEFPRPARLTLRLSSITRERPRTIEGREQAHALLFLTEEKQKTHGQSASHRCGFESMQ